MSSLDYLNARNSLANCREESAMLESLRRLFEKYMFQELESKRYNTQMTHLKDLMASPQEQQSKNLDTECSDLDKLLMCLRFTTVQNKNQRLREAVQGEEIHKVFNFLQASFDMDLLGEEEENAKTGEQSKDEEESEEDLSLKDLEDTSVDKLESASLYEEGEESIEMHTINPQEELNMIENLSMLNREQNQYRQLILNKNLLVSPHAIGYLKDLVSNITVLAMNRQLQTGSQ